MIIELRKCIAGGFTVHEEIRPWTQPRTFHESAFSTLDEALAFIRSRVEPAQAGKEGDYVETKAGNVFKLCKFIEREDQWQILHQDGSFGYINESDVAKIIPSAPTTATTRQDRALAKEKFARYLAVTDGDLPPPRSRMEPEAKPAYPEAQRDAVRGTCLDTLQRLGQEYDATPTDPPWKRAKVGDWVKVVRYGLCKVVEVDADRRRFPNIKVEDDSAVWWPPNDHILAIVPPPPTPPRHGDFGSRPEEDGA